MTQRIFRCSVNRRQADRCAGTSGSHPAEGWRRLWGRTRHLGSPLNSPDQALTGMVKLKSGE
jgi:hypothetical protein